MGFLWDCDIINGDHCDLNDAFSCSCPLVCRPVFMVIRGVWSTVRWYTEPAWKPCTGTWWSWTALCWWSSKTWTTRYMHYRDRLMKPVSHVKDVSCSPADLWSIFHSPVPTEWALLWDRRDLPLQLLPRDQGVLLTFIVFRDQNSLQTP